ncbi:MAG: YiiD C-terminal domain-containing protein [Cellvibrionales bacterium]|nr:YiiD C-terminal domain-containing protein [Cellvibrionales bacterium]
MTELATDKLRAFITKHLPLIQHMGIQLEDYQAGKLTLSMPLFKNHNDKMTAFGGSLYCLNLTTSIGLLFIQCFERGIEPNLVVRHAEIDYFAPASSPTILAKSQNIDATDWEQFFNDFNKNQKAFIEISSETFDKGQLAVTFTGQFAIIGAN